MEEGGKTSLRSVTFLVPLELDCDNEERNELENGMAQSNREESAAEASTGGRVSPTELNLHSTFSEPSEGSSQGSAVMQLSGLHESPSHESADPLRPPAMSQLIHYSETASLRHYATALPWKRAQSARLTLLTHPAA